MEAHPLPHPDTLRRGACPTLAEPMRTADGLLARFRPATGGFSAAQLAALARAARDHGNGLVEITARGSVQVRGLREESVGPLRAAFDAAGIVAQTGLGIEISPLAGIDPEERADPRLLAGAIREAYGGIGGLSPKLSIIIDGGGQIALDHLKADVRLVAGERGGWALAVGEAVIGEIAGSAASQAVGVILERLRTMGARARGKDIDAEGLRGELPVVGAGSIPGRRGVALGAVSVTGGKGLRVALPFGQVAAERLEALAGVLEGWEVRPAPDRSLVLVGGDVEAVAGRIAKLGFWTADGPALTLCSGAEQAGSGVIHAAQVAAALVGKAPDLVDGSVHIHVSTCTKGCAHRGKEGAMLVGEHLFLHPGAAQKPLARIDPAAIEDSITHLAGRIRMDLRPGETIMSRLGRLGQE